MRHRETCCEGSKDEVDILPSLKELRDRSFGIFLRNMPHYTLSCSAPSCCAFTHWVAFEEVSGPRVLFKSRQGNRGLSACGTTHGASLKFPSEAGYILRYAGKAGEPSRQRRGIDSPVAIRRSLFLSL